MVAALTLYTCTTRRLTTGSPWGCVIYCIVTYGYPLVILYGRKSILIMYVRARGRGLTSANHLYTPDTAEHRRFRCDTTAVVVARYSSDDTHLTRAPTHRRPRYHVNSKCFIAALLCFWCAGLLVPNRCATPTSTHFNPRITISQGHGRSRAAGCR